MASPKLYATFLLWLLSELFEALPEVGDPAKPTLAFFFDEAHLLFDEAPKALMDKVEQVVRLIRSKGVGVYFITQNPIDIPEAVAGQLGNRVQHALRAFTPRDQKAVKSAAETFRANPDVDVATVITELKVGEALVSLLQPDGAPSPVTRTLIKPPCSRVGPLTDKERAILKSISPVAGKYDTAINRESAAEILSAKAGEAEAAAAEAKASSEADKAAAAAAKQAERDRIVAERTAAQQAREAARQEREASKPGMLDKMMQSAARSAASSVGRQVAGRLGGQIVRGILGGLFKGR
jgi:DNA helicase HerA-like ATPase